MSLRYLPLMAIIFLLSAQTHVFASGLPSKFNNMDSPDRGLDASIVRLNKTLPILTGKLNQDDKARFEVMQKMWASYRDAECKFQFSSSQDKYDTCVANINNERSALLEDMVRLEDVIKYTDEAGLKNHGAVFYHLTQFVGTYRYDAVLKDPVVETRLQSLVGKEKLEIIKRNIDVRGPISLIGADIVLAGNAPHQGGSEEAMVLVNVYSGVVRAALLHQNEMTLYAQDKEYRHIPKELRDFVNGPHSFEEWREMERTKKSGELPERVKWVTSLP